MASNHSVIASYEPERTCERRWQRLSPHGAVTAWGCHRMGLSPYGAVTVWGCHRMGLSPYIFGVLTMGDM